MELTPDLGDAATASCPCSRSFGTSLDPMSPVPPITTIFMIATSIFFHVPPCVSPVKRPDAVSQSLGKFECIGRRRSAWCTKAELSDPADSETPRRLPHAEYVLHRARCSQEDDQLLREGR